MSKNGVPQEQLDALKRLFDIINKRIANPIQTTDGAYLDSNLNLRGKFLSDFFKTHIQREFETNGFKGLRRLTPEVYKIITVLNIIILKLVLLKTTLQLMVLNSRLLNYLML